VTITGAESYVDYQMTATVLKALLTDPFNGLKSPNPRVLDVTLQLHLLPGGSEEYPIDEDATGQPRKLRLQLQFKSAGCAGCYEDGSISLKPGVETKVTAQLKPVPNSPKFFGQVVLRVPNRASVYQDYILGDLAISDGAYMSSH
jgi:hypothetical protein